MKELIEFIPVNNVFGDIVTTLEVPKVVEQPIVKEKITLLDIFNGIVAENGVEKHKMFIEELVTQLPKKGIYIKSETYWGDYFNEHDHKDSYYTDVETLIHDKDINDYQHVEDIKFEFGLDENRIKAEFVFETHLYVVEKRSIEYLLDD